MTLWQRARTRASATPPDYSSALADLERALPLVEQMEMAVARARATGSRARASALGRAA